jgi:hypothetical protein
MIFCWGVIAVAENAPLKGLSANAKDIVRDHICDSFSYSFYGTVDPITTLGRNSL